MIEVRSIEVAGEEEGLLCTSDLEDHRPSPPKAVLEMRVGCYGVRPEPAPGHFGPAPHGVMRLCAGCARKTINALAFMLSSISGESLPEMLGFGRRKAERADSPVIDGIRSGAELMLACLVFVARTRGAIFAGQIVAASEERARRVGIAGIVDAAVRRQANHLDGPNMEIGVDLVRLAEDLIEASR